MLIDLDAAKKRAATLIDMDRRSMPTHPAVYKEAQQQHLDMLETLLAEIAHLESALASANRPETPKSCPCCGGEAAQATDSDEYFYVVCQGCFLRTTAHKSKKRALAAWNRRPEKGDANG